MRYFLLVLLFTGCIAEKQSDFAFFNSPPTYEVAKPVNENEWGFIDGVRVDRLDTIYDHITQKRRVAGLIGSDTIWEYEYSRKYINTDSGLFYFDKQGKHKF